MITLLRNAALNSLKYKQELALVKNQNIDISHFEENMEAFKDGFARNYELASRKFKTAIEEIDKTIDHLDSPLCNDVAKATKPLLAYLFKTNEIDDETKEYMTYKLLEKKYKGKV